MIVTTFPNLLALPSLPVVRQRISRTIQSHSVSGKRTALQMMLYPLYRWTIPISVLRIDYPNDFQTLLGFLNQLGGPATNFYYRDLNDYRVVDGTFGTGNGITKLFQLSRNLGGFNEPVWVPNPGTLSLKDNAVTIPTGNYTLLPGGVISFATAPAAGRVLSWTGDFWWLAYLVNDTTDFTQFDGYRYESELVIQSEHP